MIDLIRHYEHAGPFRKLNFWHIVDLVDNQLALPRQNRWSMIARSCQVVDVRRSIDDVACRINKNKRPGRPIWENLIIRTSSHLVRSKKMPCIYFISGHFTGTVFLLIFVVGGGVYAGWNRWFWKCWFDGKQWNLWHRPSEDSIWCSQSYHPRNSIRAWV